MESGPGEACGGRCGGVNMWPGLDDRDGPLDALLVCVVIALALAGAALLTAL